MQGTPAIRPVESVAFLKARQWQSRGREGRAGRGGITLSVVVAVMDQQRSWMACCAAGSYSYDGPAAIAARHKSTVFAYKDKIWNERCCGGPQQSRQNRSISSQQNHRHGITITIAWRLIYHQACECKEDTRSIALLRSYGPDGCLRCPTLGLYKGFVTWHVGSAG